MKQQNQERVFIEHLTPEINNGRYCIKRVVGESLTVEADILADGHDHVRARLLFRHEDDENWSHQEMKHIDNDKWHASFELSLTGFYRYTVTGWIDHALTWYHRFLKKHQAGQNMSIELLIGANYLEAMLPKASDAHHEELLSKISLLRDETKYELAVSAVLRQDLLKFTNLYPDLSQATTYSPELKVHSERKKAGFSSWYSFFPRSSSSIEGKHGTFKDCERLLPRIAEMGFDVLYFPPIHPIGKTAKKGKNNTVNAQPGDVGVPYAIGSKDGGHKDILEELGTLEDFKHLIKEAASYDLEIAMDFAIQCSPDHPYVTEHPEWFTWRPDGTIQCAENPPKIYQDIYPINFETEDWENLWKELRDVLLYWCDQGIRIFRVDNPHTKAFNFWEWCIAEVQKAYPGTIFLSEAFTRPKMMKCLAKLGFAQSYTYFTWRNTKKELVDYFTELTTTDMKEYFRPNLWPNTHDINPSCLQNGLEPAFISRYFMAATLSSNYGIFGPVFELMYHEPYPGKEEYLNSEKYELRHWDWSLRNKLTNVITKVNATRKGNKALQSTNNLRFCEISNDQLLAYHKQTGKNHVLCVVNLDPHHCQSGYVQVPLSQMGITEGQSFKVFDVLTEQTYVWSNEWNYVELRPWDLPVHLFIIEME